MIATVYSISFIRSYINLYTRFLSHFGVNNSRIVFTILRQVRVIDKWQYVAGFLTDKKNENGYWESLLPAQRHSFSATNYLFLWKDESWDNSLNVFSSNNMFFRYLVIYLAWKSLTFNIPEYTSSYILLTIHRHTYTIQFNSIHMDACCISYEDLRFICLLQYFVST